MNFLPLLCPPRDELEILLKKSLLFEDLVMHSSSIIPHANLTQQQYEETRAKYKEEHIHDFWNVLVAQKKAFCRVDTEKLFGNSTRWEQILDGRLLIKDWD